MKLFSKLFFITILIFSFSVVFANKVNNSYHKKMDKWHQQYTIKYNKKTHRLTIIPKLIFPVSTGVDDPPTCLVLLRGYDDDITSWWLVNNCSNVSLRFWIGWNGKPEVRGNHCFVPGEYKDLNASIYEYTPTSAEQWPC